MEKNLNEKNSLVDLFETSDNKQNSTNNNITTKKDVENILKNIITECERITKNTGSKHNNDKNELDT
jgi:hypothetical protein